MGFFAILSQISKVWPTSFQNVEPSGKNPIHFELSAESQDAEAEAEVLSKISKTLPVKR